MGVWLSSHPQEAPLVRLPNQYLPALGKAKKMCVGYGPGCYVGSSGEMAWSSGNEETSVGLFSHLCQLY